MARTPADPQGLHIDGTISSLRELRALIQETEDKLAGYRKERDTDILNALSWGMTYSQLHKITGLARSSLIKINDKAGE